MARLTDKQNRDAKELLNDIRKEKTATGAEYSLTLGPDAHASAMTVLHSLAEQVSKWREPSITDLDKRWLQYLVAATETLRFALGEDLGTEWDILVHEITKWALEHVVAGS